MRKENYEKHSYVIIDCTNGLCQYSDCFLKELGVDFPRGDVWDFLYSCCLADESAVDTLREVTRDICTGRKPQVYFMEVSLRNKAGAWNAYRVGFICTPPMDRIVVTFSDISKEKCAGGKEKTESELDELTGLWTRRTFCDKVEQIVLENRTAIESGEYALACFDVIRFKAINDFYGMGEGDKLLKHIAGAIDKSAKEEDIVCRSNADHFLLFTHTSGQELELMVEQILTDISLYGQTYEVTCNVGIYVTGDAELAVEAMIDRAVLAKSTIKGSYTIRYSYFTEQLREEMLTEQEIVGMISNALAEKHFLIYYQPQYNHSTGMLVGAEALVRWKHPEKGLISPGVFIPIFEKNGFITRLDLYVFEEVCAFIRKCIDEGEPLVPISTNFSRYDIFQPNFVEKLEEIRNRYDVPVKYLRVEITESAIVGGSQHTNDIIHKLHSFGYIVEMDDFGSGYSSLNVLKDIELDIIKLDMLFLSNEAETNRGGTIVSAVIRMAKWLGIPVIAEGVETVKQADFLKSIGCDYIQGYLYSRPLPEADYEKLITDSTIGNTATQMRLLDTIHAYDFWDPESLETLIFSNYVGGAAIFDYQNGQMELSRVNTKYLQEIGMNLSEKEMLESDFLSFMDEDNQKTYIRMLERAIESGEEQECETWRNLSSSCCGEDRMCIRATVRVIGKSDDTYLFYAMIRNVTGEKLRIQEMQDTERRFKMASEQVNIYFWEYTVATKEMRPCFRCMRDLGLPAVLNNYPESAFEMGVFPPEVHEMYRDWHKQIANGVKELEAVIPLTVGRVPFRVKYTTEFDENGRPVKAYGSAALVVNEDKE
ncbi:MAG: bifunctional diguanylate cyclase/phosphodiesterase [Lachnospiraceae bacterium]|nr:bifunctional diguanylate cyclase/phosphodiesterase [Lachnospiraceae bacterium]